MGSRIRVSVAAVHETAATLGFSLKKEQEKVIVDFRQGHDAFVALPTGFGKSLCYCCLPYVFDNFEVSLLLWWSVLLRETRLLTVLV